MKRALALTLFGCAILAQQVTLPNKQDSFHFAVIGDTGTGERNSYEIAQQLAAQHRTFPFSLALMLGDNMYGGENAADFEKKFERPFGPLLSAGVKFYAALGNHDDPNQRLYKHFNMNGERFYTFKPRDGIRFFALDSNYMDKTQIEWFEKELDSSQSDWKICFFHHPLYSSGERHGSDLQLRAVLEPMLVKHNVTVVLAGHEHFYERLKPQHGIHHFTCGSSAKLRKGNIGKTDLTAKGFDTDNAFMLMEIDKDELHFQTISRKGATVDSGVIKRR